MTWNGARPAPWSEIFAVRPAPTRFRSGLIAAVSTAVPILIGQRTGQASLGLIASSGALAALYSGSGRSPRAEAVEVGLAAAGLTASFAVGTALAGHPWANVAGNALWAAVATAACALARARPPGIVMLVLLATVGGGLQPGQPGQRIAAVAAVAFGAAALCWLAAFAQPRPEGTGREQAPPEGTAFAALPLALRSLPSSPIPLMSARTGIGVGLAGAAALLCQLDRPYWAMAAAGAVMARGSFAGGTRTLALLRGTGTAAGCLLAGAVAAVRPEGAAIALVLAALTFVTELVVVHNYAAAMVFVTPLSTVLVAAASHDTAVVALAGDRLLETLLGCLAAVVAGQLVTGRWALRQRQKAVARVLLAVADLMEEPTRGERFTALHHAHLQLQLVGDRTAAERPTVRTAASPLDHVVEAARDLALHHLTSHHLDGRPGSRRATAGTLPAMPVAVPLPVAEARRLAGLLLSPADGGPTADAPQILSPDLASLRTTIHDWAASAVPLTNERRTR
ncbi:FUSC family protein [Streptomyces griseofuscus]|uniref:FUSC family protein n=1 Tax=Streptomyces griseofuscus TaxID=146922 RepID=UPI00380B4AC7